ncbi:MAG TPA: NAD(+)/NADH kinase, partial [Opitutales bacterium]|nr:NAD(+)/NADH kinase [Opitutales bacterium]
AEELYPALEAVLEGRTTVDERVLLQVERVHNDEVLTHQWVLNEAVVHKGTLARMIELELYIDGSFVCRYRADGLIVATPTGSTAYNLSAGGPLIHPHARVLALTPICPHTLTNRSVIFSEETRLEVRGLEEGLVPTVSCDGQPCFEGGKVLPLGIALEARTLALLQPPGHSHFKILRDKLRWGEETRVANGE